MTPTLSPLTRQHWQAVADRVSAVIPEGNRSLSHPQVGSWLIEGDVFDTLDRLAGQLSGQVAVVFADPPYFIGKGAWDRRRDVEAQLAFSEEWLAGCRELLTESGSLWVSGCFSSTPVVGYAMQRLGMKLLCQVTWEKPNPRNISTKRHLRHATESVLWAAKHHAARHRFNYDCMRRINGGQPPHSHWRMATPERAEKRCGHHPTQKPVALVERCLLATTRRGDLVLDPFLGSGTTAVAARRLGRACIGIDQHRPYLEIAKRRLEELEEPVAESQR
jgi:site-specific DNA-methyltransferase (adenine-specific)